MLESRLTQILAAFALANLLIVAHLVRLQVIERAEWVAKGEENRTRRRLLDPIRGPILFADGRRAAESEVRFDLVVKPSSARDRWPIGALTTLLDKLERGAGFWRSLGDADPTREVLAAEAKRRAARATRVLAHPERALRSLFEADARDLLDVDECLLDGNRARQLDALFGRRRYRRVRATAERAAPDRITLGAALALDEGVRTRLLERLAAERDAFTGVRLSLEARRHGFVEAVFREIVAAERNAAARLRRRSLRPSVRLERLDREGRGFYRKTATDHLARARRVMRRLSYETVYRVDAAVFANYPVGDDRFEGLLAGFDLKDYLSRVYPCDIAPHLVGVTGDVPRAWIDAAGPDETESIVRARALDRGRAIGRQRDILARSGLSDGDIIELRTIEEAILSKPHTYDRNVGRSGIESAYEHVLRGRRGSERVLSIPGRADPFKIHAVEPADGAPVHLTIDSRLQTYGQYVLARDRASRAGEAEGAGYGGGALVALDPRTGRVLALVTDPTYERETIQTRAGLAATLARRDRPFRNRALETHTPGSIFKVFTAILAVEETGLGRGRRISCWARNRPGKKPKCSAHYSPVDVALDDALAVSCNAYFTTVGEYAVRKSGTGAVPALFDRLGLSGRPLASNMNARHEGRIGVRLGRTDKFVFKREFIAQTAIGQGPVVVSPLHVAKLYAIVANRGLGRALHVTTESPHAGRAPARVVSERVIDTILPGLIGAVSRGTANKPMFRTLRKDLGGMEIAGKTGSATFAKASGRPKHAWFAGFAPARDPEIVVVVFLEHRGKGGGEAAGPLAAAFLSKYFHLKGRAPRVLVDTDG